MFADRPAITENETEECEICAPPKGLRNDDWLSAIKIVTEWEWEADRSPVELIKLLFPVLGKTYDKS